MRSNNLINMILSCLIISIFVVINDHNIVEAEVICGQQGGGALCPDGMCCSNYGHCGYSGAYCDPANCQSQCPSVPPPPPAQGDVSDIITKQVFEQMLPNRNALYTYDAFLAAARYFGGFGTTGTLDTRKRELAAFFAQTSHETAAYYNVEETDKSDPHCQPNDDWPCVSGQKYYGRGPIQISYNYNYGPAGNAIGLSKRLLSEPSLVATNSTISFKTAIWFWMTPQYNKPSCHNVMVGAWTPSDADKIANRFPGFGVTTNIINGGFECGPSSTHHDQVIDRINYYKTYCDLFHVTLGDNLDCKDQTPFNLGYYYDGIIKMPVDQA